MSAICGVVALDGRPWTAADLDGVLAALAPLGPDGLGRWSGTAGRCGVALAAALRHSTPEDAADSQPAVSAGGSLVLVGDLRLDNRDELAASLGLGGSGSRPDSAFVLAGYERWGESLPERLLGDFAFAIVDRRRGGVLLVRDHLGSRPLVVHRRPDVVAFASTALALTGFEGVGHELDVRRAALALGLVHSSDRTFVEGVRWLPPASALWIAADGLRQWEWWTPDPTAIVDLGSPEAHERELREAFDAAVAARLRSAGRVGAGTSGGLDSASAAATAAELLAPEPLPTYTSAPPPGWRGRARPNWDADESPLVLKLAERHPTIVPSFVHVPPAQTMFDLHTPLWELGAGPARNPCNALWLRAIRTRAASDGVTTLLNGARGNLYFSADGHTWLTVLVRSGRPATAWREALAWANANGQGRFRTLTRHLLFPLLPREVQRLARAATGRDELIDRWTAAVALRPEILADLDLAGSVPALDPRRPHWRAMALWTAKAESTQADSDAAVTALTGVEERDSTSDRRVIEVAMRQPEWVRRRGGMTRAAVRGAMADRLPPEILHRERRGEQLPDWLDVMTAARGELASELDKLEEHPASLELIDTARLRRLMDRWPDRTASADPDVISDYRLALLRALLISRYLRWFEARADAARRSRA